MDGPATFRQGCPGLLSVARVRASEYDCHGSTCILEGPSAAVAGVLSDLGLPGNQRNREATFHLINRNAGNRIRYRKVDEEGTGEEGAGDQIVEGTKSARGSTSRSRMTSSRRSRSRARGRWRSTSSYRATKSTNFNDIRPYYIVPDGEAAQESFSVIRQVIEEMKLIAVARVLTSREPSSPSSRAGTASLERCCGFPTGCAARRNTSETFAT